jgi:hypothetical protein
MSISKGLVLDDEIIRRGLITSIQHTGVSLRQILITNKTALKSDLSTQISIVINIIWSLHHLWDYLFLFLKFDDKFNRCLIFSFSFFNTLIFISHVNTSTIFLNIFCLFVFALRPVILFKYIQPAFICVDSQIQQVNFQIITDGNQNHTLDIKYSIFWSRLFLDNTWTVSCTVL